MNPQLRGIAVAPLLCRVYDTIMDNRFSSWYLPNPEQSGFRAKQGCLLPLFSLFLLISFSKQNNRGLFVGFLDFEKAFDYVNRAKLLTDLMDQGCGKKYLCALANMYKESSYAPKVSENQLGESITTFHGVTQGRNSSTNLFSFFVSDMPDSTRHLQTNDFLDPYNLIQLADDTMLLAEDYESLRKKFISLLAYSRVKFQVPNVKKTYFCHFASDPVTTTMRIDDSTMLSSVDICKGYTYLGMVFLPTNDVSKILQFNINNRMKHVSKFYGWLDVNANTPIPTKLLVLDNCVFGALLYGCETWGDITCIESKLLAVEMQLLKRILCVKKGTSNDIVLFELKRPRITNVIHDRQYKFFVKLQTFSSGDAIITNLLQLCNRSEVMDYYRTLRGTECVSYMNSLEEKILTVESSMITYYRSLISLQQSCMYSLFINDYYRQIITRWRMSNHSLKIETGRYSRPLIPRDNRVCGHCNVLEDEQHVIFECPLYYGIRCKYQHMLSIRTSASSILNPNPESIIDTAKLLYDIEAIRKDLVT